MNRFLDLTLRENVMDSVTGKTLSMGECDSEHSSVRKRSTTIFQNLIKEQSPSSPPPSKRRRR